MAPLTGVPPFVRGRPAGAKGLRRALKPGLAVQTAPGALGLECGANTSTATGTHTYHRDTNQEPSDRGRASHMPVSLLPPQTQEMRARG